MRQAPILLTCIAGAALLAACAGTGNPDAVTDQRYDGVYAGTRTQEDACGGEQHAITFHVAGSRITVESRHKHRRLSGTVTLEGAVALTDFTGGRHISGEITGDRISATEEVGASGKGKHHKSRVSDPTTLSCLWRFEAVREPGRIDRDMGAEQDGP